MSSQPESYNWNEFINKGTLDIKDPSQDEGVPTESLPKITYGDEPLRLCVEKQFMGIKDLVKLLPAQQQSAALKEASKLLKGDLKFMVVPALQNFTEALLAHIAQLAHINSADVPANLREKFDEIRGKTPNNTPSNGIWHTPRPQM